MVFQPERRPKCRYFVTASELFNSRDQEHSREWWKDRGAGLRLESERDAMELQFVASGTLYFYEGRSDRVTATTICGAFPPSAIGEVVRFRNQPIRFALSVRGISCTVNRAGTSRCTRRSLRRGRVVSAAVCAP